MLRSPGWQTDRPVGTESGPTCGSPRARRLRRRLLRRPLSLGEARRELECRLARREADFLALAARRDLRAPRQRLPAPLSGTRAASSATWRARPPRRPRERPPPALAQGVHLTVDEAKGRQPVVRGSLTLAPEPDMLTNPLAARHVPVATSGSRGAQTVLLMDVAFVRDQGVNVCLAVDAAGGGDWVKAAWEVPGGSALYRILKLSSFGPRVARWFTQVGPIEPRPPSALSVEPSPGPPGEHRRGRAVAGPHPRAARRSSSRRPLDGQRGPPRPHSLDPDVSELRGARLPGRPRRGHRALTGARFTVAGEPVTAAKLDAIRRSGARAAPRYGTIETGSLAWGCLAPAARTTCTSSTISTRSCSPATAPLLFVTSLRRTAPSSC